MRGGKFLAEESPDNLQMQYQCDSLEEVFLKLAIIQNKGKRRRSSIAQEISDQVSMPTAMTVSKLNLHKIQLKQLIQFKLLNLFIRTLG